MFWNWKNRPEPANCADQGSEHAGHTDDDAGDESGSKKHDPDSANHGPGGGSRKFHSFRCFVLMLF